MQVLARKKAQGAILTGNDLRPRKRRKENE